jgi:hypothetical protein
MVIVGVVALLVLIAVVAMFKMTPHRGASAAEKRQAKNAAATHRKEPRASGLD